MCCDVCVCVCADSRIAPDLDESVPNLEWLILTNNAMEELVSILVSMTYYVCALTPCLNL